MPTYKIDWSYTRAFSVELFAESAEEARELFFAEKYDAGKVVEYENDSFSVDVEELR